ncbi:MAG: hypothetical protein ACYSYL_16760 [Planctomycetota bacterium]|jgi:hypothetical protein
MRELRIDMDLTLNLHGRIEVDEWMLKNRPEMVYDLLAEKLTREFRHAMRETIVTQMGGRVGDLGEIRDLVEKAVRAGPMDCHDPLGKAWYKLRRLTSG